MEIQLGDIMGLNIDSKVIGYIAFTGSPKATTIKKIRFGEIVQGINKGAPYSFDEQSYNRFYPLANKVGFSLKEEDFTQIGPGFHFVAIRSE